eukprot:gnl/MRDRNA2_/MRDRNA2_51974_c0_seq1.p1 gnl/MRDRNA2_/MRDRNA2_51974_c0~~gnl/MRDRNA2_/MRDRNA2_51974_c0_seq1.p1  ORF type:complete len:628 (+),score=183.45 gnl/MRDRNA2_/MRDRNA2_51974_c0_seq1:133-2016(+)
MQAEIDAIGQEIRELKEKLKAEGLSGKKVNEHPEVKEKVAKLQELKSGGEPAAKNGAPSPKAAPKEAPKAAPKAKEAKKAIGKTTGDDKPKGCIDLEPPSGTRDFLPDDMRQQRWLFDQFAEVARLFNFQEYDAPVLENEDLYKRKAGEEITEQMYNFVDKEGAKVTLRPEMTPSLARMVLGLCRQTEGGAPGGAPQIAALMPLKWYSIPQCWRFETTQRGRKREHYQWNMDVVGTKDITAELELLAAICEFFKRLGITSKDVGLKINSRKVLAKVLQSAGVPDDKFAATTVVIDKLDKIGPAEVKNQLMNTPEIALPGSVADIVVKCLAAKDLDEFASLAGADKNSPEVSELIRLFDLAEAYGFRDWLVFDASVVRGLAYYTGVVWEGFDKAGVLRAICGGGRYDRLLTLYGSKVEIPCCGFGFGDCVIVELLKEKGVLPSLPRRVDFVVAAYNDEMMGPATSVAAKLRQAGKGVDVLPDPAKKVAKAFNYADRVGADKIAFVAPGEWEQGLVRIKDLREPDENKKQQDIPIDGLTRIDEFYGGAPKASAAAGASAGGGGASKAPSGGVDQILQDYPYLGGYCPGKRDREEFEKILKGGSLPTTPDLQRWFKNIESFTPTVRNQWT